MSIASLFKSKASSTAAAALLSSVLAGCSTVPSHHEPIPYVGRGEPQSCRAYRTEQAKVNRNFERATNTIIGGIIGSAVGQNNAERRIAQGIGAAAGGGVSNLQQQQRLDILYNQCQSDIATLNAGICRDDVRSTSSGRLVNGRLVGNSEGTVRESQNCQRTGSPFPAGGNMPSNLSPGGTYGGAAQPVAPAATTTTGQACEPITMQDGARALLCTDPRTGSKHVYGLK